MESYKELIAYQKGYQLTLQVYENTERFPKEEIYGTISQMRRSAVSIPCNITEGYRRGHREDTERNIYSSFICLMDLAVNWRPSFLYLKT